MKYLFLCLIILFVVSCGDDFKKVEALGEFRILSVATTTPEVVPGAVVNLRLFVSDVKGGGRLISGTTIACIDPGISFGAKVKCDHDPSAVSGTYDIDTANDADLGAANLFTGLATDVTNVTVPAGIFIGRSATEQFNGVSYIVIFDFTVDGRVVSVFKRIVATNRGTLNTNPTGSAIFLNGVAIVSAPNEGDKLKVETNAPETYDFINSEGATETKTETFQVAWFVTQGKFSKPKSNVDEIVEYQGDTPTVPSLVVSIVRDDRGGVEIVRESFP
jgi:hypothetical protein